MCLNNLNLYQSYAFSLKLYPFFGMERPEAGRVMEASQMFCGAHYAETDKRAVTKYLSKTSDLAASQRPDRRCEEMCNGPEKGALSFFRRGVLWKFR